jgi:type IV secretory pathway VirB10-like protein
MTDDAREPAESPQPPRPEAANAQTPPPPSPPHEMRLRAQRHGVTRLSRRVLVGASAVACGGVCIALAVALWPHRQTSAPQAVSTGANILPEGIASLPKDYTGTTAAPKLGAPLPGDLGKPMLKAGVTAPGMPTPITAEQQRVAQEQDAARTSHLFATTNISQATALASPPPASGAPLPTNTESSSDPTGIENMQDRKIAFMNGPVDSNTASPNRVAKPASPYVIQAGWVIAGALITGIESDLPGEITAQVTENIYDSPTGQFLLIPQGSKLSGKYSSQVSFGQTRVQVTWTRLTFPNGDSIILQNSSGSDPQGYSGLEDGVDNHWGALFKAAILSTVLSVGAEAGTSDSENNLAQAIRQGASQSISQTGQQIVERNLNVQPTLTDRPGLPLRIIVDRDLVLAPYQQEAAR